MSAALPPAILHLVSVAIMTYGYLELPNTPQHEWIQKEYGGHLQFLTIQGLALGWLTQVISVSTDLFPTMSILKKTKRWLFMISLPVAVTISTIYWSLLTFAPRLILRPDARFTEPSSSSEVPIYARLKLEHDLALHAAPALTLLADFLLFERKYTHKDVSRHAPLLAALFALWYGCWIEYCASYNHSFPYPFLTLNPLPIRIAIYAGATSLAYISLAVINSLRPASPLITTQNHGKVE